MKIERTHDMQLVSSIMFDPAIWPHAHDDGAVDWQPVDMDGLHWMLVKLLDDKAGGLFLVHPQNSYCYEMHTCLLPHMWGEQSARAAQMLLQWAFEKTDCQKMVTNVPAYNRAALRFATAGGMTQEGINRASFMRKGELVDQIMLGITKQEWKTCQQQSHLSPQ